MSANTEYNRLKRVQSAVNTVWWRVRTFHLTHDDYIRLISDVRNSPDYEKLAQHRQSYLRGYEQALYDTFWREGLDWRVLLNGEYLLGDDVPRDGWRDCVPGGGKFFHKGTMIPFTTSEDERGDK